MKTDINSGGIMSDKGDELLVYFFRHGGTAGNEQKRYIGVTDEVVTEAWKKKLGAIRAPAVDIVYSSPMLRCRQTAAILYPNTPAIMVDGLRECDFGRFEGKNYIELSSDTDYQRWIDSGGKLGFPQGEDISDFKARVSKAFLEKVVKECLHKHLETAAVITHGGVIMGLLETLGDGSTGFYDHIPANGECVECVFDYSQGLFIRKI
jgi:alpha-ribazole phosphatase